MQNIDRGRVHLVCCFLLQKKKTFVKAIDQVNVSPTS